MKIIGIGNAIVDVLCKVEDNFLEKNSLTKSTMKLINEIEFKNLLSNLTIQETISGGSVANSIVGLSQLGNDVGFIGKIKDDELGLKYENGLVNENVKYLYSKKDEPISTGSCLILITPDSERTMCTFLGTAGKISANDIDGKIIKSRTAAGLLALFLGGIGVHKFYCGSVGLGIVYLIFFWTFIPAIIAFIEGIIYLTQPNDETFTRRYCV